MDTSPPLTDAVDVVVPTYNARDMLLDCLDQLEDRSIARRIVVDDGSDDGTVPAVIDRFPDVDVVGLAQHRGLSYALNMGAKRGTASFVLFLNNDVLAEPGSVDDLVTALAAAPNAVSAGGRLVNADGRKQDSYGPRELPDLTALVVRVIGIERIWPRNPWTGGHLRHPMSEHATRQTERQLAGACLLVRRDAFEAIGGWDERYWFWYEDVDLAQRLLARGASLYVPAAVFRHVGRGSTRGWTKPEQHRRLYHGTLRYGQSYLGPGASRVLAAVITLVCLPRLVVYRAGWPDAAAVYADIVRLAGRLAVGREIGGFSLRPTPVMPPRFATRSPRNPFKRLRR